MCLILVFTDAGSINFTSEVFFLFLLFNGLLVYIFYEFDKKKSQNKDLIKGKNPINPYDIPASEHPIIKSAKNRLRKNS